MGLTLARRTSFGYVQSTQRVRHRRLAAHQSETRSSTVHLRHGLRVHMCALPPRDTRVPLHHRMAMLLVWGALRGASQYLLRQ